MTLRLGNEVVPAEKFIYARLAAESGAGDAVSNRLYGYAAAQQQGTGITYPAIVWQLQAPSEDVKAIGNVRIMSRPIYVVRVIVQASSWNTAQPIADAIDRALEGASGIVDAGEADQAEVLTVSRIGPFSLVEAVSGVQYRHLGGQYRLFVQLQQP